MVVKFSQELEQLLQEYSGKPLPLGILLERSGEHGFGLLIGFLVLPCLIPLPLAGLSTLLGGSVILLGLQLAVGRHQPWLPKRVANIHLSPKVSQALLKNLGRALRPLERITQPRLPQLTSNPWIRRLVGICIAWCAALMGLPLPIPGTNSVPAINILTFVVGLIELDGVVLLLGVLFTFGTTVFFLSIAALVVLSVQNVLIKLQELFGR